MEALKHLPTTGLPGLDKILGGLRPGDNVVWQVDSIEDYAAFVAPYLAHARRTGRQVVYFRYALHRPLAADGNGVELIRLEPEKSFENLIISIHRKIAAVGRGGLYLFDSLSELSYDCYSDRMTGCFFMLTCPYLYRLDTIAYFAVKRNYHSFHAAAPIAQTPQVLLDVYRYKNRLFVHPLKLVERYSPTMYMVHAWERDQFVPVNESATTSEVLTSVTWPGNDVNYLMGVWSRNFIEAEQVLEESRRGTCTPARLNDTFHRLLRMLVSRDERVLQLAERYLTLADLLDVRKRMIGSGMIGGKSVGVLLARAILKKASPRWSERLEAHDSFFIGTEVFYEFLVLNKCWDMRQKQKDPRTFLDGVDLVRERILEGHFPEYIRERFGHMLSYFGQSPIIVRSSSLLEDNFSNAFPGKYESVFCANQGSHADRLERFVLAVKTIYASTMSEQALNYRAQRGILDRDEQMAILVQRVSGAAYGALFFPQAAGVGFSFNPFVWNEEIEPEAGVLRLVFGLGTRAVDRCDDDYTRLVALNAPHKRPEADGRDVRRYSQRRVDVLDLQSNALRTLPFEEVLQYRPELPLKIFADRDREAEQRLAERGGVAGTPSWFLSFNRLLRDTSFVQDMRDMLATLQQGYEYPVDVEFAVNFFGGDQPKINLLQCRPFQFKGGGVIMDPPANLDALRVVFKTRGAIIGRSMAGELSRIVYVPPVVYGRLPIQDRHAIARLIGQIMHLPPAAEAGAPAVMLLGPGRWGTSTPSLGVPVSFADINTVAVLCEIVGMNEDVAPDVSLGTHFFSNLVESDILYLAIFPGQPGNELSSDFFEQAPNRLPELLPKEAAWSEAVRVIDGPTLPGRPVIRLNANTLRQQAVCYLDA